MPSLHAGDEPPLTPEQLMRRALDLAARGRGSVEPNPLVGCVIAEDGRILGEGWHQRFGGPHAEPLALADCRRPVAGATAYVTLEPCCHSAKKTPPCVPALVAARLGRVVAACEDPNPAVRGQGLIQLRQAGIEVQTGLLAASARQLNAAFFARAQLGRPYITLKWAVSADGKVAGAGGQRRWISSPASRDLVHRLRARCDAILVGIGTVLADDPLLTTRGQPQARPLLRCILDADLRLPVHGQLARTARQHPTVVYAGRAAPPDRERELASAGVEVVRVESRGGRVALDAVLADLWRREVTHLLVEGGPTVAGAFLAANLADRLWVFRSVLLVGQLAAPAGPTVTYPAVARAPAGPDTLCEHLNPDSRAFHAAEASTDFLQLVGRG